MAKKDDKNDSLQTGRFERLFNVGTLSGRVGSSYLWSALKRPFQGEERRGAALLETHLKNVERIVQSSKELRGAFMKLTQILSMRDDLFPAEAIDVLSIVQSGVPPMSYDLIRSRVEEELGGKPENVFAEFEKDAFAAASLGQVHRATLRSGEEVVVKIQYPNVEKTVESDLRNIQSLIRTLKLVAADIGRVRDLDWSGVHEELRERMYEELDYEIEAANIELFRELLADDPDVIVPRVIREHSTKRLITMERIEGYRIREVLAPGVDQETKDWVIRKMYNLTWRQLLEFGIVHVDPHPGNYLVTHHPKLGILDFGCVRIFTPELRQAYRDLNRAILEDDSQLLRDSLVRLDFINPDDDHEAMRRMLRRLFAPVLRDEPVDPRSFDSLEEAQYALQEGIRAGYWKAPPHRVFLDRVLIGMDGYLKLAGSVQNWHRMYRKWIYCEPKDVTKLVDERARKLAGKELRDTFVPPDGEAGNIRTTKDTKSTKEE